MKQKLTAMLPYLAVLVVDFYLLPFLARDTGTAMLLMLCVMPAIALVAAIACGTRQGLCPLLPIAALALFLPTIFLHYNASAWIYAPFYAVLVLIGNVIGRGFYGKR